MNFFNILYPWPFVIFPVTWIPRSYFWSLAAKNLNKCLSEAEASVSTVYCGVEVERWPHTPMSVGSIPAAETVFYSLMSKNKEGSKSNEKHSGSVHLSLFWFTRSTA